jgi:parallel beta-helix repeat protein
MRYSSHRPTPRRALAATALSLPLLVALIGLTIAGAQASPAQVRCGDRITTDTTLHKDLVNCANNGIIIGADNVTFDLNGHTIDGNGKPDTSCDPVKHFCDFGVAFARHHGVVVKDGSIRQFEGGILVFRSKRARLVGLSTRRNHFSGIGTAGSAHILVRNSSGNGTTASEGNGIGMFGSRRIRVVNSTFKNNAHVGIKPVGSKNSLIKGNLVAGNGDEGLLMEGGNGFRITRNRVVGNGAGITLGPGTDNLITGNRVFRGRDGIRVEKGHDNLVEGNLVVRTRKAGIRLGIPHPLLGGAHNIVRRNRVRGSRVDGFLIGKKDRQSVLKGNVARGAGDDGFDVASRTTTLTSNRALRNGDLGIEAVGGVTDGGGNVARHNGDPRQCTNVACK